eukprot:gene5519-11125_t
MVIFLQYFSHIVILSLILFMTPIIAFSSGSGRFFKSIHSYSKSSIYMTKSGIDPSKTVIEVTASESITNISMGFSQLRPFLQIAQPFFKEDEVARNSLIGVIAMTFLNSGVSVAFSYISRDFYNALNARDETMFYEKIALFFAALVVAVPVSVYYRFLREKLALYWREALTAKVLDKYYANRTFYVMETLHNIDNPDQRISDDIRSFTRTSLDFLITLLTSVIDLFSFSAILFQIYPGLFIAIIIYAGLGSIITTNLGRSLVGLNYDRLQKEADFRFALIRTRENAEAIAFYDRNAKLEQEGLWTLFKGVLETQLGIVTVQRNLEYFTTSYRYLVQILPSLIVAPLYFARKIELGSISQSYGAFNHILNDFSLIINSFESLSAFSAGLTRLSTFLQLVEEGGWNMTTTPSVSLLNPLYASGSGSGDEGLGLGLGVVGEGRQRIQMHRVHVTDTVSASTTPLLLCENLVILTPDASRVLVGGLSTDSMDGEEGEESGSGSRSDGGIYLTLNRGSRVLVVGPSGAGKSSFVRAIAGLWEVGSGSITWTVDSKEATVENKCGGNGDKNENTVAASIGSTVTSGEGGEDGDGGPPKGVFFLPQKPYNFLGTLRQQIQYPAIQSQYPATSTATATNIKGADMDSRLLSLLDEVCLGDLAGRVGGLDAHWDWSNVLSLGEQQRLAFARVLFNKPSTVVLDEATSALDLGTEERMYRLLEGLGVTCISVGHRPSLLRYHDSKLVLSGPGKAAKLVPIGAASRLGELIDLTDISINMEG